MRHTDELNWNSQATRLIKSEMVLAGVNYDRLSKRLAEFGIIESYKGIANKINRGTFTFAFFLQCMHCLRVENIKLGYASRATPASQITNDKF